MFKKKWKRKKEVEEGYTKIKTQTASKHETGTGRYATVRN